MTAEKILLGAIINIKKGSYITKKEANEGPYPVILGGQEPAYYIDKYNHTGRAIVISRSGASAGYVSRWNEPIFVTDGFLIEPKEAVDFDYLYYLLKYHQPQLQGLQGGAAIPHVNPRIINAIEVIFPSIDEQTAIAGILSDYDNLIENNQKQIKLLEEAAQRLYKEWFVDLRFPGYEDTPIVDGVPEGWKKVGLASIAPIVTGKKDANFGTADGKYLFFTCAQEPIKAPSYSFDCDAVILAGNGDFNVKLYRGQFEAYQRTYVFSPYDKDHLYLLYHAVRESMRQLFQGASGSTIKFLTKHMLEDILVHIPEDSILQAYNSNCEAIQKKIECLKNQIISSQEARDRLLPKLMSGEIEVQEVLV